jgi:2-polyprenyl-3-methyl-5-hydroxy-6-metoxy-1,4-benzoquinol methylase
MFFSKKAPAPDDPPGPDAMDSLPVIALEENSDRVEAAVRALQAGARSDEKTRALLAAIYYEEDRAASFHRYAASRDFAATLRLLRLFGITTQSRIVEVGAGPGFLASALNQHKFRVEILEPSTNWNSGTGYLRTRPGDQNIVIHSDHISWHAAPDRYEVVLTKNCLHHFPNMTQVAVSLRQKLNPGGWWIALREWFADDARELAAAVGNHPFRRKDPAIYEWPYPAHHYVEALEMAGLRLHAVVPSGYDNGCLGAYSEEMPSRKTQDATARSDRLLERQPERTVKAFWGEVKKNRFEGGAARHYTRPQALIFRKVRV